VLPSRCVVMRARAKCLLRSLLQLGLAKDPHPVGVPPTTALICVIRSASTDVYQKAPTSAGALCADRSRQDTRGEVIDYSVPDCWMKRHPGPAGLDEVRGRHSVDAMAAAVGGAPASWVRGWVQRSESHLQSLARY
jgi:hypothetical protein